jgi:hypothetical protein
VVECWESHTPADVVRARRKGRAVDADVLDTRAARNESLFREINERIEGSNASHHWVDPPYPDWVCECARQDCSVAVRLTVKEYEAVRSSPVQFLVAPSEEHVAPDVEQVVGRHDERYWVVEKRGAAGDMSEDLDPRSGDS